MFLCKQPNGPLTELNAVIYFSFNIAANRKHFLQLNCGCKIA